MTSPMPDGIWTAHWAEDAHVRADGFWWACEEPERAPDPRIIWHYRDGDVCRGCRIKAAALLRQYPGDTHVQWLNDRLAETS